MFIIARRARTLVAVLAAAAMAVSLLACGTQGGNGTTYSEKELNATDDPNNPGIVTRLSSFLPSPDPSDQMSVDATIEGTWQWPSLKIDTTGGHLLDPQIYPVARNGVGWTFTIAKNGDGYTLSSAEISEVKLSNDNITIMEETGSGDIITFTGRVVGDTMVGTVKMEVPEKTGASGVTTGEGVYEGDFTSNRVK